MTGREGGRSIAIHKLCIDLFTRRGSLVYTKRRARGETLVLLNVFLFSLSMTALSSHDIWKVALGELELSVSKANFETWFLRTRLVSIENGVAKIAVGNPFTKEWLENRYNHIILQALARQDPSVREISCFYQANLDVAPGARSIDVKRRNDDIPEPPVSSAPIPSPASAPPPSAGMNPSIPIRSGESGILPVRIPASSASHPVAPSLPNVFLAGASGSGGVSHPERRVSNLNPRYTFENFIVGENNELARAACFAVSQSPGTLYNPLFIYGVVGVGKTHLIQAIGNEVIKNAPEKTVRYTTSEQFTNELIDSLKNQSMEAFKTAYREIDVLLIDDVQFLSGREKTQQEFFHVFNNLYQANKQIVITSDRTPKAIPTLEDRLKSRFEGGMIADVSRPGLETRVAILRLKLLEKGNVLADDCVRFIAENITNNARELEGALNRVLASAEFQKVHPTVPYVEKVLGNIITANKKSVTLESIARASAEFYNVPEEALQKKGRKKEIAFARQVAMYLVRTELDISLSAIGKFFGGRDHTTVLHAVDRVQKDMEKDGRFKEDMVSLRERLYRE